MKEIVRQIDALLPQTQCRECGFSGCMPYAEALVQGAAPVDRCLPGGIATVNALAHVLKMDASPWLSGGSLPTRSPAMASIREEDCIGCTKCIAACPVDAIIGTAKRMHAIINTECTGCGLCVEPCPVDCIELLPLQQPAYDKDKARERFKARKVRHLRQQHEHEQSYRIKRQLTVETRTSDTSQDMLARQEYIRQAMARVKAKKS